jgi:hypothetical protein
VADHPLGWSAAHQGSGVAATTPKIPIWGGMSPGVDAATLKILVEGGLPPPRDSGVATAATPMRIGGGLCGPQKRPPLPERLGGPQQGVSGVVQPPLALYMG